MIIVAAFWWMGLVVIGVSWLLSRNGSGRSTGRA
jgi:hypothetical protein